MPTVKQLFILSMLILITLFLRDLPYINVVIINKMWILYIVILLLVLLSSIKFRVVVVSYLTGVLFFTAFVLTLLKLNFFAEAIGALVYFFLWILFIHRLITYHREMR